MAVKDALHVILYYNFHSSVRFQLNYIKYSKVDTNLFLRYRGPADRQRRICRKGDLIVTIFPYAMNVQAKSKAADTRPHRG